MAEVSKPPPFQPARSPQGYLERRTGIRPGHWLVIGAVLAFFTSVFLSPVPSSIWPAISAGICRQLDEIGTAMYQYSLDHNGQYPTGKSSTEVFQKLIDGKYVSNPTIFYAIGIGNRSKTPATSNELLPNNICFDVTIPVTTDSPKGLPLVFVSGFKITYEKGAKATAPFYSNGQIGGMMAFYKDDKRPNSWSVYWFGSHKVTYQKVAFYKSGDDVLRTIPNFVSQDFKPDGVKYQQLTPDGPLAP